NEMPNEIRPRQARTLLLHYVRDCQACSYTARTDTGLRVRRMAQSRSSRGRSPAILGTSFGTPAQLAEHRLRGHTFEVDDNEAHRLQLIGPSKMNKGTCVEDEDTVGHDHPRRSNSGASASIGISWGSGRSSADIVPRSSSTARSAPMTPRRYARTAAWAKAGASATGRSSSSSRTPSSWRSAAVGRWLAS